MGLTRAGIRGGMPVRALGAKSVEFTGILLVAIGGGILEDEGGIPRRAAIICARSW